MRKAWWAGAGAVAAAVAAAVAVVACSYMPSGVTEKAMDAATGMMSKDKAESPPPQQPPAQPAQPPQQAPHPAPGQTTVIVVQPPAGGGGRPMRGGQGGAYGGMPPECQDMGTTREGTSACYRKLAEQVQTVSDQCGKRAASGMDNSSQKQNEECRDSMAKQARAMTCVADDIMKPGTQLKDVQKACNVRYGVPAE